jgi:site-specific recombinase XerD
MLGGAKCLADSQTPRPRSGFRGATLVDGQVDEAAEPTSFAASSRKHSSAPDITELIAQGADIKLVQAIAGHKDATMTLNVYGHLMTERVSEAADLYDPLAI